MTFCENIEAVYFACMSWILLLIIGACIHTFAHIPTDFRSVKFKKKPTKTKTKKQQQQKKKPNSILINQAGSLFYKYLKNNSTIPTTIF